MKRSCLAIIMTLAFAMTGGCAESLDTINQVQTNLVDKRVFEGDWWYSRTVVDLDDDGAWAISSAGAGAPWIGATANFDIVSNSGNIGRIRWVIDENHLYAYRAQEIISGASADADDAAYRGQPLAIFPISSHVDVRQGYSTLTGERTNVIGENTTDRRWYDRQYMRVDWSQNLVTWGLFGGLDVDGLFATFNREPVQRFVQEGGDSRSPDSWRPQFVRVGEDSAYRWRDEWPSGTEDTVHYMSFVTHEIWTPRNCPSDLCRTSIELAQRHSFLRIPPNHEYAVETLSNREYDRFGVIRTENRTYIRGGNDRSERREHCTSDADCNGAACDAELHYCVGGLSNEYGETDFLTYYRLRHNFYADSLTDRDCRADWECDNRHGYLPDDPNTQDGSVCDRVANRCTIPLRNRPTRPVAYRLSPGYPRHLVRGAMQVGEQWNETFMAGQRRLTGRALPTGERVQCQSDNPVDYCFCDTANSAQALEVSADGTCAHRTNLFVPPADRGETDPYDCWISVAGQVEGEDTNPARPTSYDDYSQNVYNYRFEGEECLFVIDTNSCDRPVAEGEDRAPCEAMGDIRYQFFNYASGAGAGWCGVMQPNQDPTNGEAIISPINMGGQCLDRVSTSAIDFWPVLRGEVSEDTLFSGENVRGYFERLGNVHVPVGIANSIDGGEYDPDPGRPALPTDLNAHINDMFEELAPRIERLNPRTEGRAHIHSDRLRNLAGTDIETRLVEALGMEGVAQAAANPLHAAALETQRMQSGNPDPTSNLVMDQVSPFRSNSMQHVTDERRRDQILERNYIEFFQRDAIYTSRYNIWWANAFRGRPINEAHIRWRQGFHNAVMLHEMGHAVGLEHNFAGSYDRDHFQDGYFNLVTTEDASGNFPNALPRLEEFDTNRDNQLTGDEAHQWSEALRTVRTQRTAAGIGNYMTSSLMDYGGDYSDMQGLGHYDRAATYYNYFNQVEAFTASPAQVVFTEGAGTSLEGLLRSDTTERDLFSYYRGGDTCNVDVDCPFAGGSSALASNQPFSQRCVRNPRYSQIPVPCDGDRNCVCSGFDDDFLDYVEFAGPSSWYDSGAGPQFEQVNYMFCSNSRLNDISWCNVFDAGESFQETIDHFRQMWQEGYPRNYYRNYRRGFSSGSRASRYIYDAAKMFQHLFFRYFYEPEFRNQTGPLGFNDQYLASIDAMNWMAELAQLPDTGSYQFDAANNRYNHMGSEMDMAGADFSLGPGEGYATWSRYQDGLYGFFRLERAGVFWDKYTALRAMTIRDWGLSFTLDERYYINFHDLFPVEMTELFGGYILNNDRWMAPRVEVSGGEADVYYLNYFRGSVRDATTGEFVPGRGPNFEEFPQPSLADTSNEILRFYAAVFALAEFPVFYDSSWESRLAIFKLDNADGFTIPDVQLDGQPTEAWGSAIPGSGHALASNTEDADYIVFTSTRLNQSFVAVKIKNRLSYNLEEEQLGFQLLLELQLLQEDAATLAALPAPTAEQQAELTRIRTQLQGGESYLESLIEVQRIFGITSWL